MPEGHSIRHLANVLGHELGHRRVAVSSPQGRFADEAVRLDGRTLERLRAHGKHLFLGFGSDHNVHIHLGLYGWFYIVKPDEAGEPKNTVRLRLGAETCVADLIAPTACELLTDTQVDGKCASLGPDPIHGDADPERAWARITRSKKSIAALLMDQAVIAGIGNVYRAEILFKSRTHPHTPGTQVTRAQFDELWTLARNLLRDGSRDGKIRTVEAEHLSDDEVRLHGCAQHSYVYKRTGGPCRICTTTVREEPLAGRTLYWCPGCQR